MTPTEEAKATNEIISLEPDKRGRVIKIRKPGMLAQYRLVGMLGKGADSEVYLNMCMPLIYLYSIDDDDTVSGFRTIREMEGIITQLGEDGIETLMIGVDKHFGNIKGQEGDENKSEIKK